MQLPIPFPRDITVISNYPWPFEATVFVAHAPFVGAARALCDAAQRALAMYARVITDRAKARVVFEYEEMGEEAYRIDSKKGVAVIYAATLAGAAYAASALFQMILHDEGRAMLPEFALRDAPDTAWRGAMLDLARNYYPFRTLMRTVDLCWLTRCNRLHLHFADGIVYRLPSKAYPKLTHPDAYTAEEMSFLAQYAAARGVMIVPEIEMPGHAAIFTRAYPELFANASDHELDDAICAGKPRVFERLETVLREVAELFPDTPYLHIGGDEVETRLWKSCGDCAAYMRKEGIADAHELYARFVEKLTRMVMDIGRTPIVWEGFPAKGSENIPRETIVMEFESMYQTAPELLEAGFRLINASWKPLYIVPQSMSAPSANPEAIYAWNPYRWEHWYEKSGACENPIDVAPTDRVLGAQICMWEANDLAARKSVRENLFALAERSWNLERSMDFDAFWRQASAALERYAALIDG